MTDDIPIPETPASRVWFTRGLDGIFSADVRRMVRYVRESAGDVLSIDPAEELLKRPHTELFALAVRAQRADLSDDLVASLLVIAVGRGSSLAAGALAQLIVRRLADLPRVESDAGDRRGLRRTLRQVEGRLSQRTLIGKFEEFRKEMDSAGEAVRQGEIWAEFKKAGVDGTHHRVIAPNLRSLKHLESPEEFKVLMAPLPLWKSAVSSTVLATVLAMEFPHFSSIADDIARFVVGGRQASVRPVLLVGPAGIGKDSLLRRAAELVGRPYGEYDVAGTSDNRIIKGTSKGWSTAAPGHAGMVCARSRCANPMIVYSELDRAGGGRRNGQVNEALLGLCEPTTRCRYLDDGLGTELDLSDVAFGFTANGIDDTPGPLLSRLRILHLERPGAEHVAAILQQARRRLAAELKVLIGDLPEPAPQVIERLEAVARKGQFHLRLADRVARALGESRSQGRPN